MSTPTAFYSGRVAVLAISAALAAASGALNAQLAPAVPPNLATTPSKPMILLNMSKDHQLSYRAYDEFSDLDGDGVAEKTYKHSFKYYGYFDSGKCYEYVGGSGRFEPTHTTSDGYCAGQWAGNFLNWATMTKMDVLRKVLYGGYRSTDSGSGATVLERAYLPTDAHSFAKFYSDGGAGLIKKLTPFDRPSITICNTTLGATSGPQRYSHSNTNPPIMRVANGDFQLWNANERWQCYWSEENGASNGNSLAVTGLNAASSNPSRNTHGLTLAGWGPDYTVRVRVCNSSLLGNETNCRRYPNGNHQPIGLLHEYGEDNQAEFALVTGSFAKNISGGVLRSNMSSFQEEVNHSTDGTYKSVKKIVHTLNKLRVYGYDYNDSTYIGADGNCTYQLSGLSDGKCTSWGNPMGEMFLESLRYLGGLSASSAYDYTNSGSQDAALDLPKPAWVDPFKRGSTTAREAVEQQFGSAQCRPINALHFNSSVTSYDHDQWTQTSGLPGTPSVAAQIDLVGNGEDVPGSSWFVGENGSNNNRQCTAKTVGALSSVRGLCPDAPAYKGSYSLAGLAYWARTNRVRTDITPTDNQDNAFKVKSYSVALSSGKPRIVVKHPTNGKTVLIQPSYLLTNNSGTTVGSGTLVDFRVVEQNATSGKFLVIWEDSEQGGDYDQDASGIIRYEVVGNNLYVYTSTFADATLNPQGFGYTISGSNKDGAHFHSGIWNFNYTDPTNLTVTAANGTAHPNVNATGGCSGCQKNQGETRATYQFVGSNDKELKDPLWYAAKWGGFTGDTATAPDANGANWDTKKLDGSAGADGIPDNYFLAIRPDELEKSLRSAFEAITESSNAAPSVQSSQLTEGSLKFQGSFDSKDGSGQFSAFAFGNDGKFSTTPKWEAHKKLTTAGTNRPIITNEGRVGKPFTWAGLSTATKTLAFGGTGPAQQDILNFLRGDNSKDGTGGLRKRNAASIMGPVVSSTSAVSTAPRATLVGDQFPGYLQFVTTHKDRKPIVWVGAGDGMLHGFDATDGADGGKPVLSYVPGSLLPRVKEWADASAPKVQSFVDGSPFVADVLLSSTAGPAAVNRWATYLFSTLGRGGKGMFALNVTTTSGLTEANASNVFRWEFSGSNGDNSGDLGYALTDGSTRNGVSRQSGMVAKMNNGKFAVLLPNGYGSTNGSAALYILFVNGPGSTGWTEGTHYRKLVVNGGANNGLSQPTWVDLNKDGVADVIYAGDLNGNLWKFDVRCADPSKWRVGFSGAPGDTNACNTPSGTGKPLFTAKTAGASPLNLGIMAAPEFQFHPEGGQLVTFATGKIIKDTDFPNTSRTHAIFGIWDNPDFADDNASQLATSLPTRADLATRALLRITSGNADDIGKGFVEGSGFKWTSLDGSHKKGWVVTFPESSEMSVSNPLNAVGLGMVGFISIVPPSAGSTRCSEGSTAYVTFVSPLTGLGTSPMFGEYNNAGSSPGSPGGTSGEKNLASTRIGDQKAILVNVRGGSSGPDVPGPCGGSGGGSAAVAIVTNSGTSNISAPSCATGRVGYRELPGLKTRPAP